MKRALVIGASGGIGGAVVSLLLQRGVKVEGLSRSDGFDLTDPQAAVARLRALTPGYDLIFIAIGVLSATTSGPEKSLRDLHSGEMAMLFAINCIGPALVLQQAPRLLPRGRQAVLAALSARVGSIGDNRLGGWYSYRSSKAALNQVIRCGAIELARTHPKAICVALHPGTVDTPFTKNYAAAKQTPAQAAANLLEVLARLTPAQSGGFFDWNGRQVPW